MFMYTAAGDGQLQEQEQEHEHRYHGRITVPIPATPEPTPTSVVMENQQHVYVSFANENCRHDITQLKEIRRHLTRFFKAGSTEGFLR